MNIEKKIEYIAKSAKTASHQLGLLPAKAKNKALKNMSHALEANKNYLINENSKDIRRAQQKKLSQAFIDRLSLSYKRIKEMAVCLNEIAKLPDPVNEIIKMTKRPNGLKIAKVRVPIGVIAIIYESRPNVTSDCAGLCIKSGNSIILRGGSDACITNRALASVLIDSAHSILPKNSISLIPTVEREALDHLLKMNNYIDLLIPRGGESLIRYTVERSKIPVIKHYKGICHTYVDSYADIRMAYRIALNAKLQRPGVCNAMETLLVHDKVAKKFLIPTLEKFKAEGVEIRGCKKTKKIAPWIKNAKNSDWSTEYLDLILSVKVVSSIDEAIKHIIKYSSNHSDAIVTENKNNAWKFLQSIDSACVYVNASTRFTDGYQFGLGAEMGISTDKIHARGPMALEELTTYKYLIFGNGQIRT